METIQCWSHLSKEVGSDHPDPGLDVLQSDVLSLCAAIGPELWQVTSSDAKHSQHGRHDGVDADGQVVAAR